MNEVFNKIFASDVLTEESKTELKTAFATALAEAVEIATAKTTVEVKTELAEQFIADKEALVEAIDSKVETLLKAELTELAESISAFRDLEVEYAEKLVEARKELANVVKQDFSELLESLDAFLETRLREEFSELRESIEESRKLAFGKKIFESFAKEYEVHYQNKDETHLALETAKGELEVTSKALTEASSKVKAFEREKAMTTVLEPLTGKPREVMEAILKTTPVEKLEETYKTFIGRVLHESVTQTVEETSEKEPASATVLAETNTSTETNTVPTPTLKVVTGDREGLKESEDQTKKLSEKFKNDLRTLAGLN